METVNGTYHSGRVELGQPVDWPDGTRVDVQKRETKIGMNEDQWPHDPEGIENLIRRWDAIQPLLFTQEELADFEATRKRMGRLAMEKLDRTVGEE
jgi:hypothetical protein